MHFTCDSLHLPTPNPQSIPLPPPPPPWQPPVCSLLDPHFQQCFWEHGHETHVSAVKKSISLGFSRVYWIRIPQEGTPQSVLHEGDSSFISLCLSFLKWGESDGIHHKGSLWRLTEGIHRALGMVSSIHVSSFHPRRTGLDREEHGGHQNWGKNRKTMDRRVTAW